MQYDVFAARRIVRVLAAVIGGAATLAVFVVGRPAAAAGELGYLLIHGPGSLFTRSQFVSQVASAGATATFTFRIENSGTDVAQYRFGIEQLGCPDCALPTVSSGAILPTHLTSGPNGYFTAPIQPGKTITYTLKQVTPKAGAPGYVTTDQIELLDTSGHLLDADDAYVFIKNTLGSGQPEDQFVTAPGQQPILGASGHPAAATAPSLNPGQKATFAIKIKNDSSTATAVDWSLFEDASCLADFPLTAKNGSADMTAQVLDSTTPFVTPVLAPGKSITYAVTVTYLHATPACYPQPDKPSVLISSQTSTPSLTLFESATLLVNPAGS